MSWHRPVGAAFLVLAAVFFVLMVYGIVAWSPLCALLLFVWMGFAMAGFLLIARREVPAVVPGEVPEPESVPEAMLPRKGRRGDGWVGEYCPRCGSPLTGRMDECGVCGWRYR